MKKLVSLSILIAFIFSSLNVSAQWNRSVKGSGNVTSKDHDISDVNGIKVNGVFDVFITQDSKEALTIDTDDNLHKHIEVENKGGILHISTSGNIQNAEEMTVHLTVKNLEEMDFSGATTIQSTEELSFEELELQCSGASEVTLEIDVKDLELDLSGASNLDLSGTIANAEIDASGASNLNGSNLEIDEAEVDVSGASNVEIHVTHSIDANASGSSSVIYSGDPSQVKVKESAASSISNR